MKHLTGMLIIGTGHNSCLPVMAEVIEAVKRRGVKLITMETPEAIKHINDKDTNLVLHLTC